MVIENLIGGFGGEEEEEENIIKTRNECPRCRTNSRVNEMEKREDGTLIHVRSYCQKCD